MKDYRPLSSLLALAVTASLATAGEHKVEKKPFKATVSLDATFLPDKTHTFQIDPDAWADFTIKELVEQGGAVKKGEAIVKLDTKDIDRKLADDVDATKLRKMALATAERDLANLEKTTPWRLETAERSYQRAKEDNDYYRKTSRPLQEEGARRSLESAERYLEYATEELEQLLKMYKEDDLTEETEEIILKRQRNAVDSAEFRLKSSRITTKRTLETTIPRTAVDTAQTLKDAEVAYNTQKESLPRALDQKRLEVKKARTDDQRADEKSAELKADRKQMNVKSPANGRVYHGEIKDGKWNPAGAAKFMKVGGKIPPKAVFATVIPENSNLQLHGFVAESVVSRLKKGQKGYVAPTAAPRSRVSVTVDSVSGYPGIDGKYHVVLNTGGKGEGVNLVPGMKGKVKIATSDEGDSIAIPTKALNEEADGSYTVKVKDGDKTKSVPVTVGAESNGSIVVTSGLEVGQTIITPDPKPATPAKK